MSINSRVTADLRKAVSAIREQRVVDRTLFITTESRYGDTVIRLPHSWFTPSTKDSYKILDIATIPEIWQELVRQAITRLISRDDGVGAQLRGLTINRAFIYMRSYLNWCLDRSYSPCNMDEVAYINYVTYCKNLPGLKKGSKITPGGIKLRLAAIESLYTLLKGTIFEIPEPWPDTNSYQLSGVAKDQNAYKAGKTKVIPEDELSEIFKSAVNVMDQFEDLMLLESEVAEIEKDFPELIGKKELKKRLDAATHKFRIKGKRDLNIRLNNLRDCCSLVILITVGMRISELLSIKAGAFRSENRDDIRLYFIQTYIHKTGDGLSEFVAPEIAIQAFKVLERLSVKLREEHSRRIVKANAVGDHKSYSRLKSHKDALFLSLNNKTGEISTVCTSAYGGRLKSLVKSFGVSWDFTSHQARRTFAVNVARSGRGDLRLLKEHFKHWSLDMSILYAAHETADEELFDFVFDAISGLRKETINNWLNTDSKIAGGLASKVMSLRSSNDDVKTYGSRKQMIEIISETVNVRSTGVAWCTAADINCGGGYGTEKTRCADCTSSVIEASPHQAKWEAMLLQQLELKDLSDIGAAAKNRAERDYYHCRQVLTDLGCDVVALEGDSRSG